MRIQTANSPLALLLRRSPIIFKIPSFAKTAFARSYSDQSHPTDPSSKTIGINGTTYSTDSWTNVSSPILSSVSRNLHLTPNHPLSITRQIIESSFPYATYARYNDLPPVVSVHQNFDSLGFPADHVGRNKTDTYYVNEKTVLRTHTSAHQAEKFVQGEKDGIDGYLITADVYRRDAIDRSHYPVFHQMEGARMWSRHSHPDIVKAIEAEIEGMKKNPDVKILDPNPPFHKDRNPVQSEDGHSEAEVVAIGNHLKRSLEVVVIDVFTRAREAAVKAGMEVDKMEDLQIRWVEAYFPFTSPSWELEVFWQGDWLELLGSGVVRQSLPKNAGVPHKLGWAFGLGVERIAMLLFGIPDIRLFWSTDERFLGQFKEGEVTRFVPFSKYPACYKDVAFWLKGEGNVAGGATPFHENDFMELVREVAGDKVEDVKLFDEFSHPKTGRKSLAYRINYRSHERTLTNIEVNLLQQELEEKMASRLSIELRNK